jgi:hypothetical protein
MAIGIQLNVVASGTTSNPTFQNVTRGVTVVWTLPGGGSNLTISFGTKTPCDVPALIGTGGSVEGVIRVDAATDHYDYTVSALVNGQPCVNTDSPEIVVG